MKIFGMVLAALLLGASAQEGIPEPPDSKVHVVTYDNFDRFIKKHPLVLMEFYAPWCGHCQNLAPIYREGAKLLSEATDLPHPVVFAKFNDGNEYNRQLRGGAEDMFNYTGYPALLVFKKKNIPVANEEHWTRKYKKRQWQFYGGGRESAEEFLMYLSAVSKSLDPFAEERKAMPGFYKKGGKHETELIVDLEPDGEDGFNTTILEDDRNVLWIVEFYSDRCPFCNSLAPEITRAAGEMKKEFKGKIQYAAVNSRVYDEIATQHAVTSWPWVAAFYRGKKVEDMAGLGGWESVVRFSKEMYNKVWRKDPPANEFLAKKGAGDGAAAVSSPSPPSDSRTATVEELDAFLATAMKYNLKSKLGADKLRTKAATGAEELQKIVDDLAAKLAPIHLLEAEVAKAKEKSEL